MEATVPIAEILKSVDLAWWPAFLLHNVHDEDNASASAASLRQAALAAFREEESLP